MSNQAIHDDLGYVRELAEAGASAPLLGGRFLTFWGALITLAYAGHYGLASGLLGLPDIAYAWLWGGFILLGIFGQFMLVRSIRNKPGGSSVGNRVEATVWMAGGFALFAYFAALILKSLATGTPAPGFEASLPIVFAIYGTGLITSGLMSNTRTLTLAGYGALAMIILAVWFSGQSTSWAIASLAGFLTVFVPGLLMLRKEPASIV